MGDNYKAANESPYDSWRSQFDSKLKKTDQYVAMITDVQNLALKKANESWDYDLSKINDKGHVDKYASLLHTELKKGIADKFGYKLKDGDLEDEILGQLGLVTEKEIKKILSDPNFKLDDLRGLLSNKGEQFRQLHYQGLVNTHVTSDEEKLHFSKYFSIDDIVNHYLIDDNKAIRMLLNANRGADMKNVAKQLEITKPRVYQAPKKKAS